MAVTPTAKHSKGTQLKVKISSALTAIVGVTGLKAPSPDSSDIDVTDLDSTAKEYIADLPDNGEIPFNLNLKNAVSGNGWHASQQYLEDSAGSGTLEEFEMSFPQVSKTYAFKAYVKKFDGPDAGTGKQVTAAVTLKVSGAVTKTVAA